MKRKYILSLLFISPLLLGNSPAPYRGPDDYNDYEINNFVNEEESFSFDLVDNGQGYIDLNFLNITDNTNRYLGDRYYYTDLLIGPGQSRHFSILNNGKAYQKEDLNFQIYGYNDYFVENAATFSSISSFSKEISDDNRYFYSFTCQYDKNTDEFGIHYAPIFKVSDQTNIYYFKGDVLSKSYSFACDLDLDPALLEIQSYTFIEGYEYYRYPHDFSGNAGTILVNIFSVIIGIAVAPFVIAGIVVGIIFLVKYIKKQENQKES